MKSYLIRMFGISLTITLITELIVAFLFWAVERIRSRRSSCGRLKNRLLLAVLVNLLTNPAAVLLCWLGRMYLPLFLAFPMQILVEIIVVAAEACVYGSFAEKPGWEMRSPVALAVAANVCSWGLGLVANRYVWLLDFLLMMR